MQIHFSHLLPNNIDDSFVSPQNIWRKELYLEKGQKIALIAASGKGKTTIAYLLAGIRKEYQGNVYFDSKDISSFNDEEWAEIRREKLSFVFQDLQLFPELSVWENIQVKNELTKHKTKEEITALIEQVGLLDKIDVPCRYLSRGQQQRVAIIRALCQPFSWLVLDEPFSHLDKENSQIAAKLILDEIEKQNAGLLLTSHEKSDIYTFNNEFYL